MFFESRQDQGGPGDDSFRHAPGQGKGTVEDTPMQKKGFIGIFTEMKGYPGHNQTARSPAPRVSSHTDQEFH